MKVVTPGASGIDTTAAYSLTRAGHEVITIERRSGPVLEVILQQYGLPCEPLPGVATGLNPPQTTVDHPG